MDDGQQSVPTLRPGGSIVSSRSRQFIDELLSLLADGAREVVVDMRDVSFISKTAVAGLVDISEQLAAEGGLLVLVNLRGVVRNLISLRRSTRNLLILDNEGAARSAVLRRRQERILGADECDAGEDAELNEKEPEPIKELEAVIDGLAAEEMVEAPALRRLNSALAEKAHDDANGDPLPSAAELAKGTFEIISRAESTAEEWQAVDVPDSAHDDGLLEMSDDQLSQLMKGTAAPTVSSTESDRGDETEAVAAGDAAFFDDAAAYSDAAAFPDEDAAFPDDDERNRFEGDDLAIGSRSTVTDDECRAHADGEERRMAAECQPSGPETIFPVYDFDTLAERIASHDPRVRWFAARGLGRIGDPRGVSLLNTVLQKQKEFEFIREMARISLRRLDDGPQ